MSRLRQTTQGIVKQIYYSLLREEYVPFLRTKMFKKNASKNRKKKKLVEQKYSKSLINASILKAKEIPTKVLRQPKTTKNDGIIPFTTT